MDKHSLIGLGTAFLVLCFVLWENEAAPDADKANRKMALSAGYGSPLVDGRSDDQAWLNSEWRPLDQIWIGGPLEPADFKGRYKLLWDENNLYVLAEIVDDTLVDTHPDGLIQYWDDDCLEVFVDENASGGLHQFNHNAFAYHIALDGKVADIGTDQKPLFLSQHCLTRRQQEGKLSTWELAIQIFDGEHWDPSGENIPKSLASGKKLGFALAYCDNDYSAEREHFIGSVPVEGEDKNRGWIDADIFGLLTLH